MFSCFLSVFVSIQVSDVYVKDLYIIVFFNINFSFLDIFLFLKNFCNMKYVLLAVLILSCKSVWCLLSLSPLWSCFTLLRNLRSEVGNSVPTGSNQQVLYFPYIRVFWFTNEASCGICANLQPHSVALLAPIFFQLLNRKTAIA